MNYKKLILILLSYLPLKSQTDLQIKQALLLDDIKSHNKLEVIIENPENYKLCKKMKYLMGEIAMYNADRWLETNMVPVAIIKNKIKNNKTEYSFCGQWVEPADVQIKNSDQLKSLTTPSEWSQMNILYFLFGQYDRHLANQVISKETGKLYLIDNEAIARVTQIVLDYSPDKNLSCPWVPIRINEKLDSSNDPESFLNVINNEQDISQIHAAFDDQVDFWTKRDMDNNRCRIFKKMLWRQFYVTEQYISAPFSEFISLRLFNKLKLLDAQTLNSFWPALPFETNKENLLEYKELIQEFINKTLQRKDMIINYFEKHPENIKEKL